MLLREMLRCPDSLDVELTSYQVTSQANTCGTNFYKCIEPFSHTTTAVHEV